MITSKYNSDKDEAWIDALYWVLEENKGEAILQFTDDSSAYQCLGK